MCALPARLLDSAKCQSIVTFLRHNRAMCTRLTKSAEFAERNTLCSHTMIVNHCHRVRAQGIELHRSLGEEASQLMRMTLGARSRFESTHRMVKWHMHVVNQCSQDTRIERKDSARPRLDGGSGWLANITRDMLCTSARALRAY